MSDRKTLITGAASGIGRALAERLADEGHDLVLVDVADCSKVAAKNAKVVRHCGGVEDESLWNAIEKDLDGLTHAAVNAGTARTAPLPDMTMADWRKVMAVNLDGAFLTMRAALRAMRRSSGPRAIVVTASITGIKPEPEAAAYCASKAAVIQLAKVAAKEFAGEGIRVNAIAPGGVDTGLWDTMDFFAKLVASKGSREAAIAAMGEAGTALGRYATSEEMAGQIAWLLSDEAAFITGAVLTSDGGYSL